MEGVGSIPLLYELEGEPSKGYYTGMRISFLILMCVLIYAFYNITLDYPGSMLLLYLVNGIAFSFIFLLLFSLSSSALIHSLKIRKIAMDEQNIYYYLDNQIKKTIPLKKIKEVTIYRYCYSRMTPFMLGVFTEQNIIIRYSEKSNHKQLRLFYIDFLPLGSLDSLIDALRTISPHFSYKIRDKSRPVLY